MRLFLNGTLNRKEERNMLTERDQLEINKIVKDNLDSFYNEVFNARKNSHERLFNNFGFAMFGTIPSEYYEQVYFASYLEFFTRQLINGIIRGLALDNSGDEFKWISYEEFGYRGFNNEEYEREYDFEFINIDTQTGYRYTDLNREIDFEEQSKLLMDKYGLKHIHIVDWDDEEAYSYRSYVIPEVSRISPRILFKEVLLDSFDDDEIDQLYDNIIECINDAVFKARDIIGLKTIPQFSGWYLYKSRESIEHTLKTNVTEIKEFIVQSPYHQQTQEDSKTIIKDNQIINRYLDNGLYKVLVGNSNIARSYLTSEYLFNHFSDNNVFDFTPVVSGYLKSIEQLLCTICMKYRYRRWIHFDFKPFTLGKYIEFIEKYTEIINYSDPQAIINCLKRYVKECRNQLFHKDNINSWDKVRVIRNNTHYLYIVILGAFDLGNNIKNDFEIVDESYDRLFRKLQKISYGYYEIEFQDRTKYRVKYVNESLPVEVNLNGLITTPISFIEINDNFGYTGKTIVISDKNMPTIMWDIEALEKEVIWEQTS